MATAAHWLQDQWAIIFCHYLTCPVQVVLKIIPAEDVSSYEQVKAAILNNYEGTEETQSQLFQGLKYKVRDRPKALIAELQEYSTHWLKPAKPGERAIVNKVVLEQVFQMVPGRFSHGCYGRRPTP